MHRWLSTDAYWALGRTRHTVEEAARTSLNFGAFAADGSQVAYARVVTDGVTFAWLCDVYVDPRHRGRGLATRLAQAVVEHLEPRGLSRLMLVTQDAHGIYARVGFTPIGRPDDFLVHTFGR